MSDQTTRWLDSDLPDELRAALRSAREDEARPAQLANLRAGLEGALGPAAFAVRGSGSVEAAADSGASDSVATRLSRGVTSNATPIVWTIGAMLAIGLAALSTRTMFQSRPSPASEAHDEKRQLESRASDEHQQQPEAAPQAQVVPPKMPLDQPPPTAAPQAAPWSAAPVTRATASALSRQKLSREAQRGQVSEQPPSAPPSLAEELASLDRIRSKLATPDQALAAVARHAKRFSTGALIPERELLQLEALLRSGQTVRAKQISRPMRSESYPYRTQALRLLADYGVVSE